MPPKGVAKERGPPHHIPYQRVLAVDLATSLLIVKTCVRTATG